MYRPILAAAGVLLIAGSALAATPERRDEAGVRAAEDRWSEAFITGDAATLDALLAPDYVSVNPAGKARPKAEIMEVARAYAANHPGEHGQPMAATSTITLMGATALVRHRAPTDVSIDLFEYRAGHLVARYSQHTSVMPPA